MADRDDALGGVLAGVVDPVLFHTLGELGTVRSATSGPAGVEVVLAVPSEHYPEPDELHRRTVEALLRARPGAHVSVELEAMDEAERAELGQLLRELDGEAPSGPPASGSNAPAEPTSPLSAPRSRTRVLAIASGKGGVGKSTVTVNLAVALARAGHTVGLLDADIYGFSVPRMLGVEHPPLVLGRTIVPPVTHGVRSISTGFFVDEDKAIAWRGPMLHKALEQFLVDVHWGSPDFLVVDMPPGTGDVALSVAQQLPRAELYVVTTPQPAAQRVAQRAGALARQLRTPLRGVIENMSWFATPDGTRYELFGSGGGQELADSLGVPLLAKVPLVTAVREGADDGRPAVIADPAGEVAAVFEELAARVVALGPARVYRSELKLS
jgi:ATP-binding protein involved in chromosome partitioning